MDFGLEGFAKLILQQYIFGAYFGILVIILGGNQRELARQKNQKKLQEQMRKAGADIKGANAGLTLEQRRQR